PTPPRPDVTGQDLSDDYVCYRLRCAVQPPDKQVTDQFGTRMEKRYRTDTLCVPARKAGATTTTSTLITLPTTTTVPAQGTLDHLKCHRTRDLVRPRATADLAADAPGFSASGCRILHAK